MVAIISSLAPVTYTNSSGSATIPVESVGLSTDIIQMTHQHSGNTSPTAVVCPGANPRMTLTMPFMTAIDAFGLGIKKLTAFSATLARFEDFERDDPTTAQHQKYSLVTGCTAAAHIVSASVNVDGILMTNVEVIFFSNTGATYPIESSTSQQAPTVAANPRLHTLGPVELDGSVYAGLTSSSVSLNAPITVQRTDGDLYPRTGARLTVAPTLNLSHADPRTVLTALGFMGTAITTSCDVYFKEYNSTTGETRSDGGAIKISIADGKLYPTGYDVSQGLVANTGISIVGIVSDGLTNPIAVTTDEVPPAP